MVATNHITIFPDAGERVVNTAECRSFLVRVVQAAEGRAKSEAPVLTGAYRDSIGSGLIEGETSAMAELYSDGIDYWFFLEYGTINNQPFRTLTNAARAVCDRVETG